MWSERVAVREEGMGESGRGGLEDVEKEEEGEEEEEDALLLQRGNGRSLLRA